MLDRKMYFVRERVGMFKLVDTYDILDPNTQEPIGIAKEEPGDLIKYARLLVNKQMLPTTVNIYQNENEPPLFSIQKPFTLFSAQVNVVDRQGQLMGYFKGKIFSLGGGFWVHNPQGEQVAEVKGDWKGWNFTFLDKNGTEMGKVTKKWAGLAKELFTSADNYIVALSDNMEIKPELNALLLSAALAVDIVYKEAG